MNEEKLYELNTLDNKKQIIKPEPLFTDTFNCLMGEDNCPIKKEKTLQKEEIDMLKSTINDQLKEIENLNKKFDDELIKAGDETKLKQVAREVKESMVVKNRDQTIKLQESNIAELKKQITDLKNKNAELGKEREDFMQTGYEADLKLNEKFNEYQKLIRKHDHLLNKVAKHERDAIRLNLNIKEKQAYEHELTSKINRMVTIANELSDQIAILRMKHGKLTPVKPTPIGSKGIRGRFRNIFRKNASPLG